MQILRNAANFMFEMSFYTISGAILCVLNVRSATCVGLCGTCSVRNGKSGEKCGKHTNFFGVAFGRKGSKNAFVTSWKSVRGKSPKIQGIYFEIYGS